METKAFFGEVGLTATSANHIANLAKEANRTNMNYLNSVQFYSSSISVIGGESGVIREGTKSDALPYIEQVVADVAKLNSLVAFFREAIKEKDRLASEAKAWEDEAARDEFTKKRAELTVRKPRRAEYVTEDDVKRGWSVGEQERYLSLEAEAAAYGKAIHEDGCLSRARVGLIEKSTNPKSVEVNGRDTIIYSYAPTANSFEVDDMFFRLQSKQRSVQAELNGMKKRIQDAIDEDRRVKDEEFALALAKWNSEVKALEGEWNEFLEDESRSRVNRMKAVESLKIVVPNRLKDVYESLVG